MSFAIRALPLAALAVTTASLTAQEPAQPSPAEMQEMMARWQEAMTPGEQHQLLERMVGDWDITVKVWQMGPEPIEATGTASAHTILGGRFVQEEVETTLMGMPVNVISTYGYDNFRRMFTLTERDNLATATQMAEGTLDQSGDAIIMFGTVDEPTTGARGKTAKFVVRFVDENTRVFELHDLHIVPGQTKVMEVTYTRRGEM